MFNINMLIRIWKLLAQLAIVAWLLIFSRLQFVLVQRLAVTILAVAAVVRNIKIAAEH